MMAGFIGVTISALFAILERIPSRMPETAVICGHSIGLIYVPRRRRQ
jgi:hypothetical protein